MPKKKRPTPRSAGQLSPRHLTVKMFQAVRSGDYGAVQECLKGGQDVNARLSTEKRASRPARETALMIAAEKGHTRLIALLLTTGAEINATNQFGQSALLYAVRANQASVVERLLMAGADPNLLATGKEDILQSAALQGIDLRISRMLIRYGADVRAQNNSGGTALHIAACRGRTDVAKLLIAAGADVNARNRDHGGPLFAAILNKNIDIVRLLLKSRVDPQRHGEALGLAAWMGQRDVVKLLLTKGFDVNASGYQGRTALHHARNRKHRSVAEILIAAGAQ